MWVRAVGTGEWAEKAWEGSLCSVTSNSVIQWTIAHQALLSMGFPRQEYWSGLPFSSPGDLPDPRDRTHVIQLSCIGRWILYHWATWEAVAVSQFWSKDPVQAQILQDGFAPEASGIKHHPHIQLCPGMSICHIIRVSKELTARSSSHNLICCA